MEDTRAIIRRSRRVTLRLRQRVGWTILFLVVTLSRLAVWIDATIVEPDASTEQRR